METKSIKRLKEAIEKSGLTQDELAARAEVSQASISYLMSGARTTVTVETLDKLADALGIELFPPKPKRKKKAS